MWSYTTVRYDANILPYNTERKMYYFFNIICSRIIFVFHPRVPEHTSAIRLTMC